MKYVLIFVVALLIIKIDTVIELGEKAWMTLKSEEETPNRADDLGEPPVIARPESNVKITPRQQYLNFLESFRVSPEFVFRQQAMELFKKHPQMFSEKLDKNLESRIYSWRDLIIQGEEELPLFLIDLSNILKGQNREIIPHFFSVVMDLNVDMFMQHYPRTKDQTCSPVLMIETAVPPEERLPELYERMGILEEYLARENLPADKKLYANLCMNTLKIHLEKESANRPPEQAPTEAAPEAPAAPAPEGTVP